MSQQPIVLNVGWTTIPARILEFTEHNALLQELVVLDENLCRDELNHLEYAEALGRAKQIYEKLYPRTGHGKGRMKQHPESGFCESQRPAFLDDKSRQLGWSRSKLAEYMYLYKHLLPEVRDLIRTHAIADNFKDLDDLAHEKAEVQRKVARLLHDEPQIDYYDAFWQACPERASERYREEVFPSDKQTVDGEEHNTSSHEDESEYNPESEGSYVSSDQDHSDDDSHDSENSLHKDCQNSSTEIHDSEHKSRTSQETEEYIDPLQKIINDSKKLYKEFYEISKMVRTRKAYTLDHVLHMIHNYCERFVGQQRIERTHNT